MSEKITSEAKTQARLFGEGFDEGLDVAATAPPYDELEMLRDQLTQTQIKLKAALSRYEELYLYSEQMLKASEKEARAQREKVSQAETSLQAGKTERERLVAAINRLDSAAREKDAQINKLKASEAALRKNTGALGRVIDKNIQSLSDLAGFVENFSERIQSTDAGSLASKGVRILLEQLKQEAQNLLSLRKRL